MASQKDVKRLVHRLQRSGYDVRRARSGHWKIRDGEGHLLGTLPSTPSEYRGLKNQLAELRRNGVRIPQD